MTPNDILHDSIGFWLRFGPDRENGGIYTSLGRDGEVYSTDKSVWMQGRAAWTFARYARLYPESRFAEEAAGMSRSCADFAERYCRDTLRGGRMYFTVTADGKPLRRRRYHFSESFFAMGCAELYRLSGEERYLRLARDTYGLIDRLERGERDPFAIPPKTEPTVRRLMPLSVPMIRLNLAMEMEDADPEKAPLYRADAADCVRDILGRHFRRDMRVTLENVTEDGDVLTDISEGRLVNPGHDAECADFLMRYAERTGDSAVFADALDMLRYAMERGADREYGGIVYFADCLGRSVDIPEKRMKLWWVHTEAMSALHRASRLSSDPEFPRLFAQISDWTLSCFPDPEFGEWYGYLDPCGNPSSFAKGGLFKGPFHLPRAMMALSEADGRQAGALAPKPR